MDNAANNGTFMISLQHDLLCQDMYLLLQAEEYGAVACFYFQSDC